MCVNTNYHKYLLAIKQNVYIDIHMRNIYGHTHGTMTRKEYVKDILYNIKLGDCAESGTKNSLFKVVIY